jgi:hypothetical protein
MPLEPTFSLRYLCIEFDRGKFRITQGRGQKAGSRRRSVICPLSLVRHHLFFVLVDRSPCLRFAKARGFFSVTCNRRSFASRDSTLSLHSVAQLLRATQIVLRGQPFAQLLGNRIPDTFVDLCPDPLYYPNCRYPHNLGFAVRKRAIFCKLIAKSIIHSARFHRRRRVCVSPRMNDGACATLPSPPFSVICLLSFVLYR